MQWRRFPYQPRVGADTLILDPPRYTHFERAISRDIRDLERSHQWQTADITDEARRVLMQEDFKAKYFRVPGTHEEFAACITFDKYGSEFRATYDTTPLIVSSDRKKAKTPRGRLRFTHRFITIRHGSAEVLYGMYNATSWLPEKEMRDYCYPGKYNAPAVHDTPKNSDWETMIEKVRASAVGYQHSPEDIDAFAAFGAESEN